MRPKTGKTGEVFFVSQALGLRHSHLDGAGYSYDQKQKEKKVDAAADFLVKEEQDRALLTSMVACLFARNVYQEDPLARCRRSLGYNPLADNLLALSRHIQGLRWKARLATGLDPQRVTIPRRFTEVSNWKGPVNNGFLDSLKKVYALRILDLAKA